MFSDFSETASIVGYNSDPILLPVLLNKEYIKSVDIDDFPGVSTISTTATCKTADIAALDLQEKFLLINGEIYKVQEIQPQVTGTTVLYLTKAEEEFLP